MGELLGSVRNAARLLREFSHTDRELGVSDLARRLDLTTSTVHRLLATLVEERLLERGRRPGTYRLGLAMYDLGASVTPRLGLHEAAVPAMAGLRHQTGETVQLAVLDGMESVYVERLESPHTLRIFSRVGTRLPATTTSTGKVLLAALDADELERRLRAWTPARPTRHSVTDPAALRSRLAEVAARGWADNREESRLGVTSVGAPVRDEVGTVIAALSVAAPVSRTSSATLRRHVSRLLDAAAVVTARLHSLAAGTRGEPPRRG